MGRCKLCNDLEKIEELDARLTFDFTPNELINSASETGCESCTVILEGVQQAENCDWSFQEDVRRVYARCHEIRGRRYSSLFLEVYFTDERPRLEFEIFSLEPPGRFLETAYFVSTSSTWSSLHLRFRI